MGIIKFIKELIARKKEEEQLTDIESLIRAERQKLKVEAIKNYERNNFLYNWGSNQNEQ